MLTNLNNWKGIVQFTQQCFFQVNLKTQGLFYNFSEHKNVYESFQSIVKIQLIAFKQINLVYLLNFTLKFTNLLFYLPDRDSAIFPDNAQE